MNLYQLKCTSRDEMKSNLPRSVDFVNLDRIHGSKRILLFPSNSFLFISFS